MDVIKFIRPRKGVLLSLEGAWGRLPPQLRHCRKSLPGAAASLMLCNPSNSQSVVSWLSSNIHRTWKKCKFLDHMPVPTDSKTLGVETSNAYYRNPAGDPDAALSGATVLFIPWYPSRCVLSQQPPHLRPSENIWVSKHSFYWGNDLETAMNFSWDPDVTELLNTLLRQVYKGSEKGWARCRAPAPCNHLGCKQES